MSDIAVEMKGIHKYFGKFCALQNVDLTVESGTIHSILGENGAGKSTLMSILYGLYKPEKGEIFINGKKAKIENPSDAIKLGIGMVHQHFMLVENLTVTENIILGAEITNKFGIIDMKRATKAIKELSEKYGLYVDPYAKIEDISVGMQQRVEILKTLYRGADILILDEPTAVLTPQEILELIDIMKRLINDGKTIIIITHKLKEIKQSAKYCTVIRRGKLIDRVVVDDLSEEELASKMVGRKVNLHIDKTKADPKDVIFSIENLVVKDFRGLEKLKGLNLEIKRGEIYGVAGVDGNGQKELIEAITCLSKASKGKIKINNKEIQNTTPKNVLESGISTIHEDRHKRGLILDFSVELNSILESFNKPQFSKKSILNFEAINNFAKSLIEKFDIRPDNCEKTPIRALSGGNQQKLIIAREVFNDPDLLIAVQPTRGLDIGAIEFVHKTLVEERDKGKAILLVSLELDEIMDVSDTIGVIYDGTIVKTLQNDENVTEEKLGFWMAGGEN